LAELAAVEPLSTESRGEAMATIGSSTADFMAWSTKRLPWKQLVSAEGDQMKRSVL